MKQIILRSNSTLWLLLCAFSLVIYIVWNSYVFYVKFKEEERRKVEIWASAQAELKRADLDEDLGDLIVKIMQNNTTSPMILINKDSSIRAHNLPEEISGDSLRLARKIRDFAAQNKPIRMTFQTHYLSTLYYGDSEVLNKLRWYPISLLTIIFLFGAVLFFLFRTNKVSEQNRLWAGMAKETAHQIGTPLTSLMGWLELLEQEQIRPEVSREIMKDIERLQEITDRFSKIGSIPKLVELDLVEETWKTWTYLEKRYQKLVNFHWEVREASLPVPLSPTLYSWCIENLVTNGIDAMKGKGDIYVQIHRHGSLAYVSIRDTGGGIPRHLNNKVFLPGVTSKERGWGLGLSLVKRIVEEYHGGKVRILQTSERGTTMQLALPCTESHQPTPVEPLSDLSV